MINFFLKKHYSFYTLIFLSLSIASSLVSQDTSKIQINKLFNTIDEIKPVEQVFVMKAQFLSKKKIKLVWEIAEKCYLYKDNFSISTSVENKIQIFNSSEGIIKKDEYFGEVEVFYSQAEIYIHIDKWEINPLKVTYQGCNELGYCYPPVKKSLNLWPESKEIEIILP